MIHHGQIVGVSVMEFFKGYNWQGSPSIPESSVTHSTLEDLPSLLNLPLADFLQVANWSGRSPEPSSDSPFSENHSSADLRPVLSLTASVGDFCRAINWQGMSSPSTQDSTTTATEPILHKEPMNSSTPDLDISALSKLF